MSSVRRALPSDSSHWHRTLKLEQQARATLALEKACEIAEKFLQSDGTGSYRLKPTSGPAKKYIAEDDPSDVIYRSREIAVPHIDPAIEHAVRSCGGWRRLKELDDDSFPFYQRDFFQHFNSFAEVEKQRVLVSDADAKRLLSSLQRGELPSRSS